MTHLAKARTFNVWIKVNEIHLFIDFSQAEQTSECVQKKRENERKKEWINQYYCFFSRYLGDVLLFAPQLWMKRVHVQKTNDRLHRKDKRFCFCFSRRFLHCCWIGDMMNNRGIRRRRGGRKRRTREICFFDRNDDTLFIYKITHFFSFLIFGGLAGRPPAGVGPGSRTGFLKGRTMRINSQKTWRQQERSIVSHC